MKLQVEVHIDWALKKEPLKSGTPRSHDVFDERQGAALLAMESALSL